MTLDEDVRLRGAAHPSQDHPLPSPCVDREVYILPVHGDYDIRHRRKNENMQHGDDAHKANNGDIKADANGNQSNQST